MHEMTVTIFPRARQRVEGSDGWALCLASSPKVSQAAQRIIRPISLLTLWVSEGLTRALS